MTKVSFLNQLEPREMQRQLGRVPAYIRWVGRSKIALGVIVLLLVGFVVIIPLLKPAEEGLRIDIINTPAELQNQPTEKPVMKNPRYESVDADNQPFTIRALEAVQQDEATVLLNKINADIALSSGLWLALSSQKGQLDINAQRLLLQDKVHLIASNGYEMRAPEAYVDIKRGIALGEQGVEGQGPLGTIHADKFTIEGNDQRVLFQNNVKLTIYP